MEALAEEEGREEVEVDGLLFGWQTFRIAQEADECKMKIVVGLKVVSRAI